MIFKLAITKRTFESLVRSSCDRLCLSPVQKKTVTTHAMQWFSREKRNISTFRPINEFVFQITKEITTDCGFLA